MITFRIVIAIIIGIYIPISLYGGGFTFESFIGIIPMAILLIIFELLLSPFSVVFFKIYLKSLKKKGKMGYSPSSVIEFYEDVFVETTPDNKTEQKYSAIERVSIVDNKVIYIHVNNIMSYLLPFSCFESKEQYNEFFEFIKTKCSNIDIY
ncbi:MAG: YcxB family protein [Clostridia bacterium]|nr:YcxB family protein [Clostridia bacterium]